MHVSVPDRWGGKLLHFAQFLFSKYSKRCQMPAIGLVKKHMRCVTAVCCKWDHMDGENWLHSAWVISQKHGKHGDVVVCLEI